jgi:predicted RNA-binding Zn-ribbon protein involved in translation (DUF1610 family)
MKGKPAKPSLKNLSKTFPELEKIERYQQLNGAMINCPTGPWISAANLTWVMQAINERLDRRSAGSESALQEGAKVYPIAHGTHITQYADEVFIWYDESGLMGGCEYSLRSAEIQLRKLAKALNNPKPERTKFIAEPGYERLAMVLKAAHDQAALGKGKERHANNLPFHQQRMQHLSELVDSPHGMSYQACKKIVEGLQMPELERQVKELLGAIVYTAGIIVFLQRKTSDPHALLFPNAPATPTDECAHSEANYQGCPECGKTMHEILVSEGWARFGTGYRLIRKNRLDVVASDVKHAALLRVDITRREGKSKCSCPHCGHVSSHFNNCVTQVDL